MNAVFDNFSAIIECLLAINTPLAVGLRIKLCKFSSIYLLFVFQALLSVTAGLHIYLQKETIYLAQALELKNAVVDSLKEKRSDATAAELHARAMAICEANIISVSTSLQHIPSSATWSCISHTSTFQIKGRCQDGVYYAFFSLFIADGKLKCY